MGFTIPFSTQGKVGLWGTKKIRLPFNICFLFGVGGGAGRGKDREKLYLWSLEMHDFIGKKNMRLTSFSTILSKIVG